MSNGKPCFFGFVQKYYYSASDNWILVQAIFMGCAEIETFGEIFTSVNNNTNKLDA